MAIKRIDSHWRDSGRSARFFIVDARAAFPLLGFLLHIKMWTFIIALIFTIGFGTLEHFGFTVTKFARLLRSMAAGSRRMSRPWWREEKLRY